MAVLNNTAMECAGDVTLRRVHATDVIGGHAESITYSDCFL